MKPILRELVQERGIDLQEYELETHGKTIFADNGIRSVPTMIVMSDEKEVSRVLGGQSRAQLESLFDKWGL